MATPATNSTVRLCCLTKVTSPSMFDDDRYAAAACWIPAPPDRIASRRSRLTVPGRG